MTITSKRISGSLQRHTVKQNSPAWVATPSYSWSQCHVTTDGHPELQLESVSCHNRWPPSYSWSQYHVTTDGHPELQLESVSCHNWWPPQVTAAVSVMSQPMATPSYSWSQCHVTTNGHRVTAGVSVMSQPTDTSVLLAPLRSYDRRGGDSSVRGQVHSVTISQNCRWPPYLLTQQALLNTREN